MALVFALDATPLGQLVHPDDNRYPDLNRWFASQQSLGVTFLLPEIADFEVRRSLLLENSSRSLLKLENLRA